MKSIVFTILSVFILFSCTKKKENKKEVLLIASDISSFIDTTKLSLKIFSDSTYLFNVTVNGELYDKIENFKGSVKIKNDSLDFFPSRFGYTRADKANLKNGYIEFLNGDEPLRMKIDTTKLKVNNLVDFSKFKKYAVFNYEKGYWEKEENINADLDENDIYQIEKLLKPEFQKNEELNKYENYLKQLIGYKKQNGEKYAIVKCFCESTDLSERFKKYVIEMKDGGKCNIFIVINLTKNKIEIFNIAGVA